jgi:hypothetical protein
LSPRLSFSALSRVVITLLFLLILIIMMGIFFFFWLLFDGVDSLLEDTVV